MEMVIGFLASVSGSVMNLLRSKIAGPPRPWCVNIISPVVSFFWSFTVAFILTFSSPTPGILVGHFSFVTSETSAAFGFVILCPSFSANLYPSPFDPVCGQDRPPVAMMTFWQMILSAVMCTVKSCLVFVIRLTFLPNMQRTLAALILSMRIRLMSVARSVIGKTRPFFSTFVCSRFWVKKSRMADGGNSWRLC